MYQLNNQLKLKTLWCIGEPRKVMINNLDTKGLSLSQASSISNLCFQRANEISKALSGINNATRTFRIGGETYTQEVGKQIPSNVAELLQEKAKLHAAQAFLMTNIKAKDAILTAIKARVFKPSVDGPESPELGSFKPEALVNESWGWNYYVSYFNDCPSYIVWNKEASGNYSDCEMAWCSIKGTNKIFKWLWNGFRKQQPEARIHPTQKPVALFEYLIKTYTNEGDMVLDNTMGSGTTILAAIKNNRIGIGIEKEKQYLQQQWE